MSIAYSRMLRLIYAAKKRCQGGEATFVGVLFSESSEQIGADKHKVHYIVGLYPLSQKRQIGATLWRIVPPARPLCGRMEWS